MVNKFKTLAIIAAMSAMVACNDDNTEIVVENPYAKFCEVNNENTPVNQLEFSSYEGFQMVDIRSNVKWSLEGANDWLSISNRSGSETYREDNNDGDVEIYNRPIHLKISVTENTTGADRSAELVLTGDQGVKSTLRIVQKAVAVDPIGWPSAIETCNAMKVGLNLFNTLDANGTWFDQDDVHAFETCWGQPVADQEWFTAVKAAGFNAVRIPVTWFPHMDADWNVKTAWMDRVEEVVNYALNEDLYVVLNVHHDTGAHNDAWVCADWQNIDAVLEKFNGLWKQIAERFNKYDEHLLFEGYNELLDPDFKWNTPASNDGYLATNALAQGFVNTVRATGGNNAHRNLVVSLYSAHGSQGSFDSFVVPEDVYPNHLFIEVHNYSPNGFTHMTDGDTAALALWSADFEKELGAELDIIANYVNTNHIPVIIGETGAFGNNADEENGKYAEFLTTYSRKAAPICIMYWAGVIDRKTYEPTSSALLEGLLKGNNY